MVKKNGGLNNNILSIDSYVMPSAGETYGISWGIRLG
jgi:hypothetical protein